MNNTLLPSLEIALQRALQSEQLLSASYRNIVATWEEAAKKELPVVRDAILELIHAEAWEELNNRFFQPLAFGTGGLRGKTISAKVTQAERGEATLEEPPRYAAIGTNMMNDQNIIRVTKGLVAYVWQWQHAQHEEAIPAICICHDTRYFSRHFAELAAQVISEAGVHVYLFEGARSTPELSFAVRQKNAAAGINITASHNPPEYNGYKVYFADGGQVVEPHASGIIKMVERVTQEEGLYVPVQEEKRGKIIPLGAELDQLYLKSLSDLLLAPEVFEGAAPLKVVYTPLHGVGATIGIPLLKKIGVRCLPVEEQLVPDGGFSTVTSPNPEQPEALSRGVALALKEGATLVLATDPDCDRMGVAVANGEGGMELLTGNQIGVLILWYRLYQLQRQRVLTKETVLHTVVIKSLVTTQLQAKLAAAFGVSCVETLTGFKYIGAKLERYEKELLAASPDWDALSYRKASEEARRARHLKCGKYFIFGGEESYGYNIGEAVRDKDGHAALLGICEVAAFATQEGITLLQLLDQIYATYGFYLEKGASVTLDGAEGAEQIGMLMHSYSESTPWDKVAGYQVKTVYDAFKKPLIDSEGEELPLEKMLLVDCEGGFRVVVRPSGTEPKIKFYLFTQAEVPAALSQELLVEKKWGCLGWRQFKDEVKVELERIWQWLQDDLQERLTRF